MAAAAAGDLGLLAANARRSIEDLRAAIEGARAQDGRRGTRFLDLIEAALDALTERVEEAATLAASAQDDKDHRAAARFSRRINYDLRLLHEAAPWVESARQGSLGLGLVYFVDEMVAGLLKERADVVMSPTAAYMYSIVFDIPKWLEATVSVVPPAGDTAVVIAYPVHEPDSLFLHLLVAHELGHSVVPAADLINRLQAADPDATVTGAAVAEAADAYRVAHVTTAKEARLMAARMARDWLTELFCDALGLAFLGPSFLYAFAAFSTPFEQTPQDSHPPFGLRIETLMDHLVVAGWRDIANDVTPKTMEWMAAVEPTPQVPERPYFEHVEAAARHLAPTLTALAREHVGDALYAHDAAAVGDLVELLKVGVLPAQRNDAAADRRAIIFAGWIHAFALRTDEPASLADITADRKTQRFLTKALEMSKVLDTWSALQ